MLAQRRREQPLKSAYGFLVAVRPQPVAKAFDLLAKTRIGAIEADAAQGLYDGEVFHSMMSP
jgi:hypothetical protein